MKNQMLRPLCSLHRRGCEAPLINIECQFQTIICNHKCETEVPAGLLQVAGEFHRHPKDHQNMALELENFKGPAPPQFFKFLTFETANRRLLI